MPDRRSIVVLVLAMLIAGGTSAASRPNVLFIAVDDLNDWEGFDGGHPQAKTPNMDRLAARGTAFVNAHCQAPLCNPSRTSLLTGLRPSTTGVYALDPWFRTASQYKDWVTLPQYFSRNGYLTASGGKIYHDAYPPKEGRANGTEFDVWGYFGNHGPFPPQKFVHTPEDIKAMDWGVFPPRDEDQSDYKLADWAIEQIKNRPKDKPLFLCVGFRKPHVPCFASQKWFDLYPEDSLVMPPLKDDERAGVPPYAWYLHWKLPEPRLAWLVKNNQWKPLVRAYLACVSFADSQIGRVVDALDAAGMKDDTIVVLWGDNGWHLGEKLITGKNSLWERSTHVPLIVAGPGVSSGRCTKPAELLDVYPTLIDLCGLPANDKLEGHSLLPQCRDAAATRAFPAITTHGPNNHGIRTERYRYIRYANGAEELYDVQADPHEWSNLANVSGYAAVLEEHRKWLPKTNADPIPGSHTRLLVTKDGTLYWEDKPINKDDPIPMD